MFEIIATQSIRYFFCTRLATIFLCAQFASFEHQFTNNFSILSFAWSIRWKAKMPREGEMLQKKVLNLLVEIMVVFSFPIESIRNSGDSKQKREKKKFHRIDDVDAWLKIDIFSDEFETWHKFYHEMMWMRVECTHDNKFILLTGNRRAYVYLSEWFRVDFTAAMVQLKTQKPSTDDKLMRLKWTKRNIKLRTIYFRRCI